MDHHESEDVHRMSAIQNCCCERVCNVMRLGSEKKPCFFCSHLHPILFVFILSRRFPPWICEELKNKISN